MRSYFVVFICMVSWLPLSSHATEPAEFKQERELFLKAREALSNNQLQQYHQLFRQLENYPLQGYLHYLYLKPRLHKTDKQTIVQFLADNQDTFYSQRLRDAWLNQLAKDKHWQTFLQHYTLPQPASRQCLRQQALIATGQHQQALTEIPALWLIDQSQHQYCDPAFAYWQQQCLPDNAMRWQRIKAALISTNFSLAAYLAKPLPAEYRANIWIEHWNAVHKDPLSALKKLPHSILAAQEPELYEALIYYGIKQLARRSTNHAFDLWLSLQKSHSFDAQFSHKVRAEIGQRAALNRQDRTLEFYGDVADQPWRARAALWQQNWPAVIKAIESLNDEEKNSNRWQYWLARAHTELGQTQLANIRLHAISQDRDYYSFLAADLLQQPYQMNNRPIETDLDKLSQIANHPEVIRLREFFELDMQLEARRQAHFLSQTLSPEELKNMALLTHQWGWHNQTIAVLGKVRYWDDLALRFPVVNNDLVVKAGQHHNIDPSWLLGIARQESAFNSQAQSHAGALGLMQLMPATGKATAKLIKQPLHSLTELFQPARNIQLGSAYLKQMYDKYQQNPVLATASYNAGPHRVAKWLPKTNMPAEVWVENIPFNETRNYTSNVMSYAAIFDYQRQQRITPISKRMPEIIKQD